MYYEVKFKNRFERIFNVLKPISENIQDLVNTIRALVIKILKSCGELSRDIQSHTGYLN